MPAQGTAATGTRLGAALALLALFWMKKSISGAALLALCCWCNPASPGRGVRWALADGQPSAVSSARSDELCLLELFTALINKYYRQRAVFHERNAIHVPTAIFQEHK